MAISASSAEFAAPSFCLMLYRCVPTVLGLSDMTAAMS
jgi:hypothetical protein